ncbi:MAG: hypothetical protein ABEI96_00745 [Haloarculaceae archaeon]
MTSSTSEYAIRLDDPDVHPTTPRHVATAVRRAHDRHLKDWIVEARRHAYDRFIVTRFGRVVNEVDTGLRTVTGSSLWKDERYRIETAGAAPARPAVRYCSPREEYLTAEDVAALRPRIREDVLDVFESDVQTAINRTLRLYSNAVAAFATRQLREFVDTYDDVYGPGNGDENAGPNRTALRSFELGDTAVTVDVPTEASR